MSQTKILTVTADNVVRVNRNTGGGGQGCGLDKRIVVGDDSTSVYRYSTYTRFGMDWDGVGRIIRATLVVYTKSSNSDPKIALRRLTSAFANGDNPDGTFDSSDFTAPAITLTGTYTVNPTSAVGFVNRFDITGFLNAWAPATVKQSTGKAGLGLTDHGIAFLPYAGASHLWLGFSDHETNALLRPTIELEYEFGLTVPDAPSNLDPVGAITSLVAFEGDFTDSRSEDQLRYAEVEVYRGTATNVGQVVTGTRLFSQKSTATNSEIVAARFHMVPSGFVPVAGVTYKWRARVTDQQGQVSDWSDLAAFSVTNTAPEPPTITPAAAAFDSLSGVVWHGGEFVDVDDDNLKSWQVQIAPLAEGDLLWDDAAAVAWDSGRRYVAPGQLTWETGYGGPSLSAGSYGLRARQWDSREGLSDWAYATFLLTDDFVVASGQQNGTQQTPRVGWKVVIRGMGASRGPGDVVAILENAKSVGASVLYNAAGELHFTLPIDHPQLHVIEPRQTHYELMFYSGDGWRGPFYGLITDMQPNDTTVIFYGVDYLGLFNGTYDERFDPESPDEPPPDGSKYVAETITNIVTDQLERAIALDNSVVGFIGIGDIADMPETVTIWSTMRPTLDFVVGLIDSHREGTGKNTRISVDKQSDGTFLVNVVDDPGVTRDNLKLRYGELVNGYELVLFDAAWATVQHAIGRTKEGLKVLYHTENAPGLDPAIWGRWASIIVIENVSDENDLLRRTKEAARKGGKIGGGAALGLRSGWLQPLDGYDICDHLNVEIVHGAVDTRKYGSGYWTLFGLTWEAGDDGSSQTNPILRPRPDTTEPHDTLLPKPTILSPEPEWQ